LLEAWKTLTRRRDDFSMGTAQPILTAFVEEVHDNEDLPLPSGAPDFVDARAAYSARAGWGRGVAGWIRLQKKAPFLVWMPGFPLEIEVGENVGEDWEEVLDQRQLEIESCLKRGSITQLGAGGQVRQPDNYRSGGKVNLPHLAQRCLIRRWRSPVKPKSSWHPLWTGLVSAKSNPLWRWKMMTGTAMTTTVVGSQKRPRI
jgi:hypothetical protein